MNRVSTGLLAVFGGAFLASVAFVALSPQPAPHIQIAGSEFAISAKDAASRTAQIEEAVHIRATQLLQHDLHLRVDSLVHAVPATKLGFSINEQAATEKAQALLTKTMSQLSFSQTSLAKIKGQALSVAIDLPMLLDEKAAEASLSEMARLVDHPPQDAQLLISEHQIVPSRAGRQLSVGASVVRLKAEESGTETLIDLFVVRTPPQITEEDLAPVDITQVLSTYETSFRGKAGARAVNIRTAGKYLDGAIVLPGETLSFNQYVGRRVHGRGFVDAPVIVNDELEQDVGGGVCQVATTLHAAAVFGDLEVVKRRSHSRPSGYAPLGLDATVLDGKVDLVLRNPYDEPLLVHVSFPSTYTIRVELLGRAPVAKVTHAYSVTQREPFARRIWHREEMVAGAFEQKQKGHEGMDVVSVLSVKYADGTSKKKRYFSKYYPVPEVFWLGEGVSENTLPAAPEGAVGLVVDGEALGALADTDTAESRGDEAPSLQPRADEVL